MCSSGEDDSSCTSNLGARKINKNWIFFFRNIYIQLTSIWFYIPKIYKNKKQILLRIPEPTDLMRTRDFGRRSGRDKEESTLEPRVKYPSSCSSPELIVLLSGDSTEL